MKTIFEKIQALTQKAAQLNEALKTVPGKAAELRETVMQAKGQLQQLRTEVESSVGVLRTDNEDGLLRIIQEIDDSAEILAETGYALRGVEVELALTPRLRIHLERVGEVSESAIQALRSATEHLRTTNALITALSKAVHLTSRVHTRHLEYAELTILVGAVPSIRLGWRVPKTSGSIASVSSGLSTTLPSTPNVSASAIPSHSSSYFGENSFFERRTPVPASTLTSAPAAAAVASPAPSTASVLPAPTPFEPVKVDWRTNALDRFKKMPDLSK